jgi:uncharacterized protein YecE (DUF72 family)
MTQTTRKKSCEFHVGTSGYSYPEWITSGFYPSGTPNNKMLPFYAQQFSVTELNHTWYQLPKADMLERQRSMVPEEFLFAVKLTRTLTHEVIPEEWRNQAAAFRHGVAPLQQARQLAAVLIQLPPSFDYAAPNRQYLGALLSELQGLPLAVEFRNNTWLNDKVYAELSRRCAALVLVDEPALPGLLPALDIVTHPALLCVRFHGRNANGWRSGSMQTQFDYHYPYEELKEWVERLVKLSSQVKQGLVFFNNHVRAQAPDNARTLRRLMSEAGMETH